MRHKLTLVLACVCTPIAALAASAQLKAETTPEPAPETVPAEPQFTQRQIQKMIDRYRHETWRWQQVMGHPLLRELRRPPAEPADKIVAWKRVAARTRLRAQNPPHKSGWLCIHRFEATWTDPNPPYYGGLQMDLSFQRRYSAGLLRRKGTADNWTPLEQMWTAERAHRSGVGFYPWPNTARFCGLI
jgi:hypothetical protein